MKTQTHPSGVALSEAWLSRTPTLPQARIPSPAHTRTIKEYGTQSGTQIAVT
jgi:hypothetical protein